MSDLHLLLFLTRGMTLSAWDQAGMFDREIALYKEVKKHVGQVSIVSYGGSDELRYLDRMDGVEIVCNRWDIHPRLYMLYLKYVLPFQLEQPFIAKSNQLPGAELASKVARLGRGNFLVRCGYLHSLHTARRHGQDSRAAQEATRLEKELFLSAAHGIVTTADMGNHIRTYSVAEDRLSVVPNYIVEEFFTPPAQVGEGVKRILFVGRLEDQKNPINMMKALKGLNVELDLVGEGSMKNELVRLAKEQGTRVNFHGNLPHLELVDMMRCCDLYLQPAKYEGHPKTILEAMACGLPVVAGDSPGISNFVLHGETAWLCGLEAKDIREALDTVIENQSLRMTMANNAREYAFQTVGLKRIVQMELEVYKKILER